MEVGPGEPSVHVTATRRPSGRNNAGEKLSVADDGCSTRRFDPSVLTRPMVVCCPSVDGDSNATRVPSCETVAQQLIGVGTKSLGTPSAPTAKSEVGAPSESARS